ncbi:LytR C-terminal domain-containing protein [Rhizomonospora bruguierae]|uniref:LytR C-terminal domain-containing protein n=1 Tax=Rhizomonospora bruguierae TaxID=1581705 RepID=UPI001BCF3F9F|nr:LytR C-terminal domain-containing protein [Micromonospora sp. NBRC 107566]
MTFARVRALVVLAVLVVAAGVFIVVALVRDSQSSVSVTGGCPAGYVPANLKLPEAKDIKIRVFNSTDRPGLAAEVSNDFKNRQVQVIKEGNSGKAVPGVVVLRYGPKAVGAAHVMRSFFLNQAKTEFNIKRQDDVVDVVIGPDFRQLATPTEFNQSVSALQNPEPPKGTCDAGIH